MVQTVNVATSGAVTNKVAKPVVQWAVDHWSDIASAAIACNAGAEWGAEFGALTGGPYASAVFGISGCLFVGGAAVAGVDIIIPPWHR